MPSFTVWFLFQAAQMVLSVSGRFKLFASTQIAMCTCGETGQVLGVGSSAAHLLPS